MVQYHAYNRVIKYEVRSGIFIFFCEGLLTFIWANVVNRYVISSIFYCKLTGDNSRSWVEVSGIYILLSIGINYSTRFVPADQRRDEDRA